jgi:hypothetical protein
MGWLCSNVRCGKFTNHKSDASEIHAGSSIIDLDQGGITEFISDWTGWADHTINWEIDYASE